MIQVYLALAGRHGLLRGSCRLGWRHSTAGVVDYGRSAGGSSWSSFERPDSTDDCVHGRNL